MNNSREKFEAFDSSYYRFLDTKPTYEKLAVFEKQDPNTIVYADRAVQVRFLNFTAAWLAATEQSQKEIAEKDARIAELEDYKNSVIDQFVTAHHSYDESISAYENISKLIAYHQDIALDPKVSSVAARWVTQIEALQAREKVLVELAKLTYGYLWHINAGLDAPAILNVTSITPEKCSHIVRKLWLDVLTKEQRGEGINKALEALANVRGEL